LPEEILLVSREIKFSIGGLLILMAFLPIGITILGNVPALNVGLLINWGVPGLLIGFAGFYMIADALFGST